MSGLLRSHHARPHTKFPAGPRPGEALDLLAPVYGWFTEGFDTPDPVEARVLLDQLALALSARGGPAHHHVS